MRIDRVRVLNGPRENRHRPAVDPMLRSIARVYGPAGIGVVLSGGLDDGAAGLALLHRSGGDVVVQDPDEASVRSMPEAALRLVPQALKLTSSRIAEALITLSRQGRNGMASRAGEQAEQDAADAEEVRHMLFRNQK